MTMSAQEMSDGIPPDAVNVYTTCRTVGCTNQDVSIFVAELYGTMQCGVCRMEITDMQDTAPQLPTEMPVWTID